jgi:hypothetical protein
MAGDGWRRIPKGLALGPQEEQLLAWMRADSNWTRKYAAAACGKIRTNDCQTSKHYHKTVLIFITLACHYIAPRCNCRRPAATAQRFAAGKVARHLQFLNSRNLKNFPKASGFTRVRGAMFPPIGRTAPRNSPQRGGNMLHKIGTFSLAALLCLLLSGLAATALAAPFDNDNKITGPELYNFDRFLDAHPQVEQQLRRNPSLANDPNYLRQHPGLQQFLSTHPGVRSQLQQNPQRFVNRERVYDRRTGSWQNRQYRFTQDGKRYERHEAARDRYRDRKHDRDHDRGRHEGWDRGRGNSWRWR